MVQAELRYLHSPDALDLQRFAPEDPHNFGILVQALIGPRGEEGEESFDFVVCTPTWLTRMLEDDEFVFGRHHLFLAEYDYDALRQAIQSLCTSVQGPNWETVAQQLGRYGKWEFEDYVPAEN